MQRSRNLWLVIGLFSLIVTLVLAGGFGYAIKDILFPQASPILTGSIGNTAPLKADKIQLVGIGDSLTKGTGDETGKGYIGYVKEYLQPVVGQPVNIIGNMAVGGHRTDQLLELLQQKGVRYTLRQANMIVLTIGGNDLFNLGQDEVDVKVIEQRMPDALKRLESILATVNELNPKAELYYVGLYNPFAALDNGAQSSLAVQQWNDAVFSLLNQYPQMTFVPSYDLFTKNLKEYLSADQFHPNQLGYERIAKRIVQVIE
jgi:lysophospholipase L1-like esterase